MRTLLCLITALLAAPLPAETLLTREALLEETNRRRAEHRLEPLRLNEALCRAADERMSEMADLGYWSHESPEGRSPFAAIRASGYPFRTAGENLARGFDTAAVLIDAWLESPGHRANILSADYLDVGFSVLEGATTGRAMGHSVVAMFGSSLPQQPQRRADAQ